MSFLLDPPLLFVCGVLIERRLPVDRRDAAEAAALGVFFGASFGLYHNVPGLGMLWRPFRAQNGRDSCGTAGFSAWMWPARSGRCTRWPLPSSQRIRSS